MVRSVRRHREFRWLLAAVVIAFLLPPLGSASASSSRCPAGFVCLWSRPGYQGKRLKIDSVGVTNLTVFDDVASSLKNANDKTVFVYADGSGTGDVRCFSPGQRIKKLAAASLSFDNVASSVVLPAHASTCVDGHPPTVTITHPDDGENRASGTSISFVCSSSDPQDGALTGTSIVWVDNIQGQLGTGVSITESLSAVGIHEITATATDSDGNTNSDTVSINITP